MIEHPENCIHWEGCNATNDYLRGILKPLGKFSIVRCKDGVAMANGQPDCPHYSSMQNAEKVIFDKLRKFIQDNSPLDGDCPPGREMNGPICEKMQGNCELCMFDAAVESVMKE